MSDRRCAVCGRIMEINCPRNPERKKIHNTQENPACRRHYLKMYARARKIRETTLDDLEMVG